MTMNTGTDIEVTYYRDRRLVNLKRGEAIFEVARDERRLELLARRVHAGRDRRGTAADNY